MTITFDRTPVDAALTAAIGKGWAVYVCDRGHYVYPAEVTIGAREICTSTLRQRALIQLAWQLMHDRLHAAANSATPASAPTPVVLVIDDLRELLADLSHQPAAETTPQLHGLRRVLQTARAQSTRIKNARGYRSHATRCVQPWRSEPGDTSDRVDCIRRRGTQVGIYLIVANHRTPGSYPSFDITAGIARERS